MNCALYAEVWLSAPSPQTPSHTLPDPPPTPSLILTPGGAPQLATALLPDHPAARAWQQCSHGRPAMRPTDHHGSGRQISLRAFPAVCGRASTCPVVAPPNMAVCIPEGVRGHMAARGRYSYPSASPTRPLGGRQVPTSQAGERRPPARWQHHLVEHVGVPSDPSRAPS